MADVKKLAPHILKWEGGYVNDPDDKGGATNKGVTLATFRSVYGKDKTVEDLKALTTDQFAHILKKYYWDRWQADLINNQSVANLLVDWTYNSGKWGIVIPQKLLHLDGDGVVGKITLAAVNNADQRKFFEDVWRARRDFFLGIVSRDSRQAKFLKGWMNRLQSFKFAP